MSYPKQVARLRPIGGMVKDVAAWEVGPNHYTEAENVVFRLGFAERRTGERFAYHPPSIPPMALTNYISPDAVNYWVYASGDAIFAVTGATHTDISPVIPYSAALLPEIHSMFAFNGQLVHNNSVDDPHYWTGDVADDVVPLPGWLAGARALYMVPHKYHLFALGMTEASGDFPNRVRWSDAAEPGTMPGTWTPAANNQAGFVDLADSPGFVLTAATMRDSLIVYKRNAIYQANFVGGSSVYEFRPLFRGVGALCPRAVVATDRGHVVLSDNDVIFHDGTAVQTLSHGRVRRAIYDQLDIAAFQRAFLVYYRSRNEVWVCIPETNQEWATRAFIYNCDTDAWSERPIPFLSSAASGLVNDATVAEDWDSDSEAWDDDVTLWASSSYSANENLLLASSISPTAAGSFTLVDAETAETVDARIEKHDMSFDQPERLKYIRRVHVRTQKSAGTLFIRVGSKMNVTDAVTWEPEVPLTTDQFVNVSVIGRFISFELRSDGIDNWKVTGVDFEVEFRGYH